jgi:FKBP-type peptidyl-prolyl cis-trans isomerase FkpA
MAEGLETTVFAPAAAPRALALSQPSPTKVESEARSSTVQRRALVFLLIPLAMVAMSCKKNEVAVGPSAPYSSTDLRVGTGTEATSGKRVTVNYTGWLYSTSGTNNKGTQFDSSVGKSPFVFVLGAGQVITGWDRGVVGMKVGGSRRLVIPPELAYGSAGAGGVIPPNATLVFDIDLLDVQ